MATGERREALTRAALELLEAEGPDAVSTRKVAARIGASTMVVYTEFGSLAGLVESVVTSGFQQLADELRAVPATDDPVADLVRVGRAYAAFARSRPDLYRVIYAVSPLAGHRRAGAELLQGADAFVVMLRAVERCFAAGRLTRGAPYAAARHVWTLAHGFVLTELAGYLDAMPSTGFDPFDDLTVTMLVGLGDSAAAAVASVAASRDA